MTPRTESTQVERVLDAYKDDLWLERRHKMDEIVRDLENLLSQAKSDAASAGSIRNLMEFLGFLERECAGDSFSDDTRQWSQLMNLMEISRKLNHKSVKLKDILANRHKIEAKSGDIRRFNEQVRLVHTIDKLVKKFESDLAQIHLSLWASWQTERTEVQDELANISSGQRRFESTLKPTIQNLQACLRNTLITKSIPPTQFETWSERLSSFSRTTERLGSFIRDYLALKRELAHLRPLVSNLGGSDSSIGVSQRNDPLGNSIDWCKRDFESVLRFEQRLEEELRKPWLQTNRRQSAAKSELERSDTKNQQIQIKLIKLLRPMKYEGYSSDLYGTELSEALKRAIECRKTLDQSMSNLRLEFGRFYFVNDLELLTIISLDWRLVAHSDRPGNKQMISKLFNNSIQEFILSEGADQSQNGRKQTPNMSIVGVLSPIGERILVTDGGQEAIPLRKRVNLYSLEIVRIFNELQRKLQRSLAKQVEISCVRYRSDLSGAGGIFDWQLPIQLFDLVERIKFTQRVEDCLKLGGEKLAQLSKFYETQLEMLSRSKSDESISELKRSAAISLIIHFISTLCELLKHNISSASDWNWLKIARHYWIGNLAESATQKTAPQQIDSIWLDPARQAVEVRLAHSKFPYKFDLLTIETRANEVKRLIHTETSERCFLVASQAIGRLKLGANPYGPAGSGKTETIKALGQLLGCQVVVHNCDQTNTTEALERLIWGLAHTGLWGCFDEFNRLSSGTLSSVSGQLELVQTSLRSSDGNRTITVELNDGQMKSIDPNSAFFITMNPSGAPSQSPGRGYRGRRRLPANLRSLFLPVAMIRVQLDGIVREMLLSFSSTIRRDSKLSINAELAERMGTNFARWTIWMRSNMQIDRCEWDLRLVMTILARFFQSRSADVEPVSLDVQQTMIECIVEEVGPRLNGQHEMDLLARGLRETFESATSSTQLNELLGDGLRQLERQLEVRPGVILLGGRSSTERSLWRSLAAEKNKFAPAVGWFQLNPKSCIKRELLGHFDEMSSSRGTAKWRDGLMTKLVRDSLNLLQTSSMQQVWLVLSGPIDPDWVESLNSVLDDNRVLTLSSGERLSFVLTGQDDGHQDKSIKLIFETGHISDASPATISRLGLLDLHQIAGEISERNNEQASKPQLANLTVVLLATDFTLDLSAHVQLTRKLLLTRRLTEKDQFHEFACFERANSRHLIELLELVNTKSFDEAGQQFLIINNLHLIECEDEWQTRTFVQLLLHVVSTMSYYDHEHNLKFVPPRLQIIVTASEESRRFSDFEQLLGAATEQQAVGETDLLALKMQPQSEPEISLDALINWCRLGTEMSDTEKSSSTIRVVEVGHQRAAHELVQQLKAEVPREKQTSPGSSELEIFALDNSMESSRTIEKLTKLIDREDVRVQTAKRRLLIIDSLQMSLLEPEVKAQLCFLLNLAELSGTNLESLGVACLIIVNTSQLKRDRQDPDYVFWLQLAAMTNKKQQAERRHLIQMKSKLTQPIELNTHNQIGAFLTSVDANASDQANLLASVLLDFFQSAGEAFGLEQRRSFLEICAKFGANLRKHTEMQLSLLDNGLKRLTEFDQMVERRRESLEIEEVQLNERKRHIGTLLDKINKEIESGREQSERLVQLGQMQQVKTEELRAQRFEQESKLASVLPKLEASKREIDDCLKPEALNELKSLRAPPKALKDILEVLFLLLVPSNGNGFLDWPDMKSYLTKFSLRDELTTRFDFEKRLADERLVARLEREISSRRQSFQLDQAARVSSAIVPVVKWLLAACEYGQALIRVRPLTQRMRTLEQEATELGEASQQLRAAQKQLDQKIASDQRELDDLRMSYEQAKSRLDSNKSQLDRARSVRSSLAKPVECWRTELGRREDLLDNQGDSLHLLSLISAALALIVSNSTEFNKQIENWLEIVKRRQFKLKMWQFSDTTQEGNLVRAFLANFSNLLLEAMSDRQSDGSVSPKSADFGLGIDQSEAKQIDHLVKLLVLKLSLDLNSGQLTYISMESDRSIEGLRQYLTYKQILCRKTEDLVLVRPASSADWFETAEEALNSSKDSILLVEMPQVQSNPAIILDILDLFSSRRSISINLHRVLLFGFKRDNFRPELRQILRELDLSVLGNQESIQIETDIENHLLEQCEPELAFEILELESELADQREHVKELELDLIKRLMLREPSESGTKLNSGDEFGSQNDLVRLLVELDQMNGSLANGIEQVSKKLGALKARRDKFRSIIGQLSQFYVQNLAPLKSKSTFYHLTPRQLVTLFARGARSETQSLSMDMIEHVMCSMRASDRQTFLDSLLDSPAEKSDRVSLLEASKRAANLRHALIKLIETPNSATRTACRTGDQRPTHSNHRRGLSSLPFRLAIALHDARKSSPQMELDEFFTRRQKEPLGADENFEYEYFKLYASSAVGGGSDLEEQLKRILQSKDVISKDKEAVAGSVSGRDCGVHQRRRPIKCICIANAHLAASWINTSLLEVVEANLTGSNREHNNNHAGNGDDSHDLERPLIVVLVAECDSAAQEQRDFSSDFDSNLLDEASLKFWYDELGLELADRWHLYGIGLVNETAHNERLRKQLVLFHVVCQELTLDNFAESDARRSAWEMGQNYSFDYEQLSLAMKLIDVLADSKGVTGRASFCHHIETIVYGARMETSQDERLLKRLVDQLLRYAQHADKNWAQFEHSIESTDVSERRKIQSELMKRIISGSNAE